MDTSLCGDLSVFCVMAEGQWATQGSGGAFLEQLSSPALYMQVSSLLSLLNPWL